MGTNRRKEEKAIPRTDKMKCRENWEKYKVLKGDSIAIYKIIYFKSTSI